ncbi:E3 ubiquitin-protein ligase TRIM56-like isoform X2 [Saccoglossus kowalevskii]
MATKIPVDKFDDDLLTCPVCLERYKNPKILPCYHSFCEECLVKLNGPPGKVICPICRQVHIVSNIHTLPLSIMIDSVIDIIKTHESQRGDGSCQGCEENSSTDICIDCAVDLCETCSKAHSKMPVSLRHRIRPIVDFQAVELRESSMVAIYCSSHSDKLVELYCEQCRIPTCLLCLESCHKGHEVVALQGVADNLCMEANDRIKQLDQKKREAEVNKIKGKKQLEELAKTHLHREQQIKKHSQETIEKLIKIVTLEENSHLNKLKTNYDKLNKEIYNEVRRFETVEKQLKSTITIISNLLQYSSAAQLMKTSEEIYRQLNQLESITIDPLDEMRDALPLFRPGNIVLQGSLGTFRTLESPDAVYAEMELEKKIGGEGTAPGMYDVPLGFQMQLPIVFKFSPPMVDLSLHSVALRMASFTYHMELPLMGKIIFMCAMVAMIECKCLTVKESL